MQSCGENYRPFPNANYSDFARLDRAGVVFVNQNQPDAVNGLVHELIHLSGVVQTGCPYLRNQPLWDVYGPQHPK